MFKILYGSEMQKNWPLFDQLFRMRYDTFITRRQWNLPAKNHYEIDQYDNDDAVYFLSISEDGSIESSARATPTVTASLMADYFPHLNETAESLRSPRVYEATRYMLAPKQKSKAYLRQMKSELFAQMTEWYIGRKLTHLQSVIDLPALPSFLEMTMRTKPLGLAHPFGGGPDVKGGGECIGIRWQMDVDLLDDFIAYGAPLSEATRYDQPTAASDRNAGEDYRFELHEGVH